MINAFWSFCHSDVRYVYIYIFNTNLTIINGINDNGFHAVYCRYNSGNTKDKVWIQSYYSNMTVGFLEIVLIKYTLDKIYGQQLKKYNLGKPRSTCTCNSS